MSTGLTLILGALVGAALTAAFATHLERHRRIRRDIRVAWKGLKTLGKMLRRETKHLLRTVAVLGVLAAVAAALIWGGDHVS